MLPTGWKPVPTSVPSQLLLAYSTLEHTLVYLHLSHKHLQTVPNPLDQLQISNRDDVEPPWRLRKK